MPSQYSSISILARVSKEYVMIYITLIDTLEHSPKLHQVCSFAYLPV